MGLVDLWGVGGWGVVVVYAAIGQLPRRGRRRSSPAVILSNPELGSRRALATLTALLSFCLGALVILSLALSLPLYCVASLIASAESSVGN